MPKFRVAVTVIVAEVEARDAEHASKQTLQWVTEGLSDNLFPGDSVKATSVEAVDGSTSPQRKADDGKPLEADSRPSHGPVGTGRRE